MITLTETMKAICDQLKHHLIDVPIQSSDISEGFSRPSLFVEFTNISTSRGLVNSRERVIEVTVFYFPTDANNHEIELLEKQESIEEAFIDPFQIKGGFYVFATELDSVVSDGVLQTSFEIQMLETPEEVDGEMMEVLDITL